MKKKRKFAPSPRGDNHQRDVVQFPRSVGTAIEDNGDNENEHATSEREAGFGQSHGTNLIPGRGRAVVVSRTPVIGLGRSDLNAIAAEPGLVQPP